MKKIEEVAKAERAGQYINSGIEGGTVVMRDGKIFIRKHEVRADEPLFQMVDLASYHLPPAPFTSGPITLADRPELVQAVFYSVRAYADRQVPSKSTHLNVVKAIRAIAKMLEFCWVNGCYSLSDWSVALTDKLPPILAEGGWSKALNIRERVLDFLGENPKEVARQYISLPREKNRDMSINRKFQVDLGTNISQAELRPVRDIFASTLNVSVEGHGSGKSRTFQASAELGMSSSLLRQELAWINLLSEVPSGDLLQYAPYPSPFQISIQLGRPTGRTANITPEQIAKIVGKGIYFSEQVSVHIIGVFEAVVERIEADVSQGIVPCRKSALQALFLSKHRVLLRDLTGDDIIDLQPNVKVRSHQTLEGIINTLFSGCFSVIGLLNARRKDEVQHRKIGLTQASLQRVDKSLDIYECMFYFQKHLKQHVPLYVGRATVRAINCLEEMERLTMRLANATGLQVDELAPAERALFRFPNFTLRGKRSSLRRWFEFGVGAATDDFLRRAIGDSDVPNRITSHMFRRGYGLLFIYRFEGPILALTQKYGHLDPTDTVTYLVDPWHGGSGPAVRKYGRLSPDQIKASFEETRSVEEEIRKISDERLEEMVTSLLAGSCPDGGLFPKLIRRLHQRLSLNVDYSRMNGFEQSKTISDLLKSRDHQFRPYWHGNCCAPGEKFAKNAHCNVERSKGTRRENASPNVCAGCSYHHLTLDHVRSMDNYAESLRRRGLDQNCGALERARIGPRLENIVRLVTLYKRRMGNDE
ncbi:hypothetical protein HNP48_000197 [Acidovorax soli]|uniref:Uncharacterized protein n=1 Tax=Acidovorax soli TaxID=592050 RepID=A0A7X0U730_9BURK|nr:hypothetical protein [Acidovorax soli]MBB6557533.1 hypothetical protein [Acidovorax soli]